MASGTIGSVQQSRPHETVIAQRFLSELVRAIYVEVVTWLDLTGPLPPQ